MAFSSYLTPLKDVTLCSCLNWAGGRGILTLIKHSFLSINLPLSFREVSNFVCLPLSKKNREEVQVGALTRKFGDRGKCK